MSDTIDFNSLDGLINGLKMEVKELRKERALPRDVDMQEVDENYVTRPPIVDLKVPQGLIDIMSHIDEDF
ncbi:hypothetical protein AYI70_g12364 [Smittium culicis]|uniref:Uncharacterized protein n=1 Tax=Smittium culicis TaxID=133412 RepID=A0A1R1WXT1_9FUNG|nr:hypothetical protein AYI70_g12364 [Smittium culicis]